MRTIIKNLQELLPSEVKQALLVFRRVGYWRKQGVIFIHIPKAGGVSINDALYGRFMGHATANQIRKYAPSTFQQLSSFAITRNPWSRCLSAYRFVKAGKGLDGKFVAGVHKPSKYNISQFRCFESFLKEWLVYQDLQKVDYVFRPQYTFVCDSNEQNITSFTGKLESLDIVYKYLTDIVGKDVLIEHRNRTGAYVDYVDWYTPELVDIVSQLYKKDIEMFDYAFE